ncbi:hypothetical protein QYF36_017487 [Acer negundo]|nr:hypothetical protein QYF36_017487 [Acer negundo]
MPPSKTNPSNLHMPFSSKRVGDLESMDVPPEKAARRGSRILVAPTPPPMDNENDGELNQQSTQWSMVRFCNLSKSTI